MWHALAPALDSIPAGLTAGLSAGAMLSILFWFLATGRLVTRASCEREKEHTDRWQAAYMSEFQARAKLAEQLDQLIRALPIPRPPDDGKSPPGRARRSS